MLIGCLTMNKSGNVFGGAEKSLIGLANWLAENTKHEVLLVSVEGDVQAYTVSDSVKFYGYNISSSTKFGVHLSMYRNTKTAIKKYKPNVLIGYWIHPLFYAVCSRLVKNITVIYSERNDPKLDYSKISRFMRYYMLKRINGVVFQTKDAKSYFDKRIQKKSKVIHNPLYMNIEDYPLYDDKENRIVTVGRLNEQKNHKQLILAFSNIEKKYPNLRLEIYGEGPLREHLQLLIKKLKLENKVFLKGAFPDVLDRIYGARLFVLSSIYEGMPNALMEAMGMGIPVVSSDCPCGGPRELINDGINGFLYECNNQKSLEDAIIRALEFENIRKIQVEEKKICNTHASDVIFNEWKDYILECMD